MNWTRYSWFGLALLLAFGVGAPVCTHAQTQPRPSSTGPAASGAPSPGGTVSAELVRQRVAEAEAEAGRALAPPAGIAEEEAAARSEAIRKAVRQGTRTLEELDRFAALEADRSKAEAELRKWTGFDRAPPHSILLVDWYRDARAAARSALDNHRVVERMAEAMLESARANLQQAAQKLRAAEERAARSASPEEATREQWRADAARWVERAAAAEMEMMEIRLAIARARLGRLAAEHELLDRQCAALEREVVFPAADLERVLAGLKGEQDRIREEIAQATAALTAAQGAVTGSAGAGSIERARVETADLRLESLRAHQEILYAEMKLWKERFEFHQKRDDLPAVRRLREQLLRSQSLMAQWRELLRGRTDANATLLAGGTEEEGDTVRQRLAREGAVRDGYYRRVDLALRRLERLLERYREELDARLGAATLGERAAGAATTWRAFVDRLWNFELFTVREEIALDGRTVALHRGITVRKVVFAAAGLVVGYLLARRAGRVVEAVARRRAGTAPGVAAALRHWVVAAGTVLALLVAFVIAQIPLTVFAFLGGALAIGIGFGTQNLMSNFISGLILLFERPVRVGDLVHIAGETGTVVEVGLRASTLRRPDGAELVIPNRDFLEKSVTNSTLSDRRLRYTIRVGVDYGSPTRRVRELLLECARRHGEVLDQPEPAVFFEDFGSDALMFALYYWVDLSRVPDPRVVASDLRFMIEQAFADAGIGISFPQRDVHLHASAPIAVRLADRTPPAGA